MAVAASFKNHFDCHKVDDVRTSSFVDAWEKKAVRTVWNSKPYDSELDAKRFDDPLKGQSGTAEN